MIFTTMNQFKQLICIGFVANYYVGNNTLFSSQIFIAMADFKRKQQFSYLGGKLTLRVLTAIVTLYRFQIAS